MTVRVRFTVALVAGLVFALALANQTMPRGHDAGDLSPQLLGARALWAGAPPYDVPVAEDAPLLYPVPALLLVSPLAWLRPAVARMMWAGLAGAIIVYLGLSRFGPHGIAILASRCAERAIFLAQWSPYFLLGAVVPPVQMIAAAKPTIALLVFAYRPSWWPVLGTALLLAASFVLRPTWLGEWWSATRHFANYYVPAVAVWRGGGPLLLLAALRWRRPEGRLLLATALIPHNFIWYDQILLFLIPDRPWQLWSLAGLSWLSTAAASVAFARLGLPEPAGQIAFRAPIVALMYLPALAMVLSRPNEAPTLERVPDGADRDSGASMQRAAFVGGAVSRTDPEGELTR